MSAVAPELELTCRQDAAEPECQELMEEVAQKGGHFICGHCSGQGFRVFPAYLPDEDAFYLRCAPGELRLHRSTCWVYTSGAILGGTPPRAVYSPGIFLSGQGVGHPGSFAGSTGAGGHWYADMTHLVNSTLMRATVESFAETNRSLTHRSPYLASPTRASIFCRLGSILGTPLLTDGTSPAAAANAAGLALGWGVTAAPLVEHIRSLRAHPQHVELTLDETWDIHGVNSRAQPLLLPHEVALAAGGRTMAHQNIIPGPYFVFFSRTGSRIERLTLWPAALARETLHLVDSSPERAFFDGLAGRAAAIKPCVATDISQVGGALWPVDPGSLLPHRPDGIIYNAGRIEIVEVAGSRSETYTRTVDQRLLHYASWGPSPDFRPVKLYPNDFASYFDKLPTAL